MPENETPLNSPENLPETPETNESSPAQCPAFNPLERIAELEEKLAVGEDNWLRAKAEAENVRRRSVEEVAKAHKFSIEKFAGELLAVKDSLEAALNSETQNVETLRSGVELTLKQLVSVFEKSGVTEVNPINEKFDPNLHQAIQTVESEEEPNKVAFVLQKGYLIAERVLRPAMVFVTKTRESS